MVRRLSEPSAIILMIEGHYMNNKVSKFTIKLNSFHVKEVGLIEKDKSCVLLHFIFPIIRRTSLGQLLLNVSIFLFLLDL